MEEWSREGGVDGGVNPLILNFDLYDITAKMCILTPKLYAL